MLLMETKSTTKSSSTMMNAFGFVGVQHDVVLSFGFFEPLFAMERRRFFLDDRMDDVVVDERRVRIWMTMNHNIHFDSVIHYMT